jgi:hypothetical protein
MHEDLQLQMNANISFAKVIVMVVPLRLTKTLTR